MGIEEYLQAVCDEQSFMAFVDALVQDRLQDAAAAAQGQPPAWENLSIADFLEGANAWARATGVGASQGLAEASPWQRFAVFLYCGKIYE
ncbi:hypothetical protein JFV28_14945 [Pseudomonas sp. TH05]|uniref:DUF7660 family protein n=1 Tax=unclassified Pseudomonas TaxID=196821 RepID=UPI001913C709|nr:MULTISPECIES: hypothetical protein [unclassified Pseudomonas]MBK5540687.1 hypothetical protein [Pseudomonas sp. TH07]MBK5557159.1 hypothetical protein [Pseudomonas sp. TH05]